MFISNVFLKRLFPISLCLLTYACGGGGGGGSNNDTGSTRIEVFDGYAVGCTVSTETATATEVGAGVYTMNIDLPEGTVVTAIACTDADTGALLPDLAGIAQAEGVVISPITTLIVNAAEAAVSPRTAGVANRTINISDIISIRDKILLNLGMTDYDPFDPATANYVAVAKADTTGSSSAASVMKKSLAISALLQSVEVTAGSNASAAQTAVAKAFADASSPIDLTSSSSVSSLLAQAAANDSTVAPAINTASTAVSESIASIAGSIGPVSVAISVTTTFVSVLNTADPATLEDPLVISNLNEAIKQTIIEEAANLNLDCVVGIGTVGSCTI